MNGQFDLGQVSPSRYFLGVAVLLGFLFAFIAPDDSDTTNIFVLLIHWQLQTVIPIMLLILSHLALHSIRLFNQLNPWIKIVSSGLIGVALYAPIGLGLDLWIESEHITKDRWLPELISETAALGPPILIAWIAINAPWIIGFRVVKVSVSDETSPLNTSPTNGDDSEAEETSYPNQAKSMSPDEPSEEQGSFLQLIPEALGYEILYMQAELHYLKIVTTRGAGLILYNLKDAIGELASFQGFQCHRSFWVSIESVDELRKDGRQGELILKNGDRIPVSRSNMQFVSGQLENNN